MSAITILGVPAEIYIYSTQNWLIISSYVILFPSVALLFVPVFRAVDISSFYEVSWSYVRTDKMNKLVLFCLYQQDYCESAF